MMPGHNHPKPISRRRFLQGLAAAGAIAAAPGGLAACSSTESSVRGAATLDASKVKRVAVHPALGISRVGNSQDLFYFGPETPGALPVSSQGFKDASGAIAKQAARFRLYAYDEEGNVLGEVTADQAEIEWDVSVANKKAAWYKYNTAMDIPEAEPQARRNPEQTSKKERRKLATFVPNKKVKIGPGEQAGQPVQLSGPKFEGQEVKLGEIFADDQGHLVYMPGDGEAIAGPGAELVDFSDNDNWTDDICDGPVQAQVSIGDQTFTADPAWVISTPPNYGPAIATGFMTLYDQVENALVQAGQVPKPPLSYANDIWPLFQRQEELQWVNAGYYEATKPGADYDWSNPDTQAKLADPSPANAEYRQKVLDMFRKAGYAEPSDVNDIPWIYGDNVEIKLDNPREWLAVTQLQFDYLQQWAKGDFTDDRGNKSSGELNDVSLSERPEALDRANLESCLGEAFHPGIEAPWTVRVPTMWDAEKRRLKIQSTDLLIRDYGKLLTPEAATGKDGPVHGVTPGDLTMWMGVPWQSDGGSCRSGYRRAGEPKNISKYLPTFWPARIPNEVLAQQEYDQVMDTSLPLADREAAFAKRRSWIRVLLTTTDYTKQLRIMVDNWDKLGVVAEMPGPNDGDFPATMKVETGVGFSEPETENKKALKAPPARLLPGDGN